jgi:hypothetical protein
VQHESCQLENLLSGLLRETGYLSFAALQLDPDLIPRPTDSTTYIETARITVNDSFDEYWNARGQLRQNLQKQRGKLTKASIEPRLQLWSEAADMTTALTQYASLEARGWKAKQGTAVEQGNLQYQFYLDVMERLAKQGNAFAAGYYFNDRLVACDLCVHDNETLIILKTTYEESEKHFSPALLMRQDLFRQMWPRFKRIEFYGRTMDWHRKWTSEIRELYHVTKFRWHWVREIRDRRNRMREANVASRDT